MLVARRDPFHPGAHDAAYTHDAAGGGAPRFARTVSMLQVVGSLLAIPVGLASAYSIYRANFSVETTCQALRANIVSMIDKSVDASTRHMLVRHDVEKFEQSCGAIDPDATAAFKTLLAGDKPAAPVARHVDAAPKESVRKAEPHPPAIAKLPVAAPPSVAATAAPRDPAVSDAQWVDAVRQALLTHRPERPAAAAAKAPVAPAAIQSQWPGAARSGPAAVCAGRLPRRLRLCRRLRPPWRRRYRLPPRSRRRPCREPIPNTRCRRQRSPIRKRRRRQSRSRTNRASGAGSRACRCSVRFGKTARTDPLIAAAIRQSSSHPRPPASVRSRPANGRRPPNAREIRGAGFRESPCRGTSAS